MNRRSFLRALSGSAAAAGAGLWLPGCSGKGGSRRGRKVSQPSLVLVYSPCTVRKSFLAPYSPAVTNTPNLARFAIRSAVFDKHQTEAGTTGVCFASMLSGGYAPRHGVFFHPNPIDPSVFQVTQAFAANGYDLHYWGDHKMANFALNYAQGTPDDQAYPGALTAPAGLEVFRRVLGRIAADPKYRAFVFTNFTLTHSPYPGRRHLDPLRVRAAGFGPGEIRRYIDLYDRHVGFDLQYNFDFTVRKTMGLDDREIERFTRAVELFYEQSVADLDADFGKVLDTIVEAGLLDSSLIFFAPDHGEVLSRKNALFRFCHGYQLAPEVQSVPLLVRGPSVGVRPGRRGFVTRSIDLFPTLVGLCGLELERRHAPLGYDLTGALVGDEEPAGLRGYSHTAIAPVRWGNVKETRPEAEIFHGFFPDQSPETMWAAVRVGDLFFKWQRTDPARPEFSALAFDLAEDPAEEHNLFDPADRTHAAILKDLQVFRESLVEAFYSWQKRVPASKPDANDLEQLRKLGYI